MEEIAIKLALVAAVALLIAMSWMSEGAVIRSAARRIGAVAVRPKDRNHAVTAYRIERDRVRGQRKK